MYLFLISFVIIKIYEKYNITYRCVRGNKRRVKQLRKNCIKYDSFLKQRVWHKNRLLTKHRIK
jgi:hypothetical protein